MVDDGSTDSSSTVLDLYSDEIRVVRMSKNIGIGAVSKAAMELIETEFFIRLDSDDYLGDDFLRVLGPIARDCSDRLDLLTCDYLEVNQVEMRINQSSLSSDEAYLNFGAGMVFRTATVREVGGYNPNLRHREDYDLHLRLREHGSRRLHVPVPLYRRYIRGDNLSLSAEHETMKRRMDKNWRKNSA